MSKPIYSPHNPRSKAATATCSPRMDSAHRSPPPPDAERPILPVTESAVQSSPHDAPKANCRPPVSTASSIRDVDAVTGGIRSAPRPSENQTAPRALVPRASSVGDEAVTGSPVRSPSQNHTAATIKEARAMVTQASSIRDEAVTGSPIRPPSRSSVDHTASPKETRAVVPRASSLRDEAVTGSPVRSPHREAKEAKGLSVHSTARYEKENSFSSLSSFRSPLHDVENPTASPQHKESVLVSPVKGAMTVGSILRSPLGDVASEDLSLEKATSPMVPVANRMVTRETTSAPRVGGKGGGGGRGSMMVESGTSRLPALTRTIVVLRILALVLSMISFSVMAADKTSGWDGDSFDRYREFRYCLSVNVLVFVYSLFQLCVHVHHKILKRRIMSRPVSYYFNFFMDQILAYLLMSASSSAASRNGDWVNDFGSDDFTKMINGSIAISFLAFLALALSSIISAYKFFTWNC